MADTAERVKSEPTLVPVDLSEIPEIRREGVAAKTIQEFLDSGQDAVQVQNGAKSFAASLKRNVKQAEKDGEPLPILVVTRGGNTYLARTDRVEAEGDEG